MTGAASMAALALALVLAWAAVAKLRRPDQTTIDFRQLGLPAPNLLARAVPAVELVVALCLIVVPGWGGVVGFALLAAFTVLLVSLLRSGEAVSCGCFGSTSEEPVSITDVARNGGLMVLAAWAATVPSLASPELPEIVLFTTLVMTGGVGLQLLQLSQVAGGLFGAELAGELTEEPAENDLESRA